MSRAVVALLMIVTFGGGALVSQASGRSLAVGSLALQTAISTSNTDTPCPAGSPTNFECFARTGDAVVPGLGAVHESRDYVLEVAPAGCVPIPGADAVRRVPSTAVLTIAGKGSVDLSTGGTGCLSLLVGALIATETFTITGGSGVYAGASGGGTVEVHSSPPSGGGADIWTGTLIVPGYSFDLTPPTIKGAKNRTVRAPRRAKRVRVKYSVTAVDDVDSNVPVTCRPRSGSRFRVGRTPVTCAATDSSANPITATFTVTVRRRR
jgi:HYR domain